MACSMIRPHIGKKWMHGLATQPAAEPLVRPKNSTKELLVVIPDRPNVLERRLAIRPRHSPNFVRLHQQGYVSWAGPLFEKHVSEGIQRPFKGSAMVVNEEDMECLKQTLSSDVYIKEGVWDMGNALIVPFRTTMRWQRSK
ncbi:hypothetical protein BDW60DRAFT_211406 [Aspergillus nidulans var. acristatus]